MTIYAYVVAGALGVLGGIGIARSRNLVHAVVCLSVAQSGTYVLLLAIGYRTGATAPIFGGGVNPGAPVVDPVVQALTLTDVVVEATVTAVLLALAVQAHKRFDALNPDEMAEMHG